MEVVGKLGQGGGCALPVATALGLPDWVGRMRASGLLRADVSPEKLSFSVLAALQGGLLLAQATESIAPLRVALDGALAMMRSQAAPNIISARKHFLSVAGSRRLR